MTKPHHSQGSRLARAARTRKMVLGAIASLRSSLACSPGRDASVKGTPLRNERGQAFILVLGTQLVNDLRRPDRPGCPWWAASISMLSPATGEDGVTGFLRGPLGCNGGPYSSLMTSSSDALDPTAACGFSATRTTSFVSIWLLSAPCRSATM